MFQWFDEKVSDPANQTPLELKFAADHALLTGRLDDAAALFRRALDATGAKAMGARRDILESLARTEAKRGNDREALEWAIKVVSLI